MTTRDEDRPLIFIHIPKTAGVSVRNLLATQFATDEILWLKTETDLPDGDEEFGRFRFITGHFPYEMIVPRCLVPPRVVTFLRDPIDRAVSNFFYMSWFVANAPDPESVEGTDRMISEMSLEQFAHSDDLNVIFLRDNMQTRLLSPIEEEWGIQCIGKESIDRAKAKLEEMMFVGIVERMFESVAMLSDLVGLPFPGEVPWLNPTTRRKRIDEIDQKVIDTLKRKNSLDLELYRFAEELFHERYTDWMRECLHGRYCNRLLVGKPARKVRIPFGGPLHGWGWYMPVGDSFRWSGPSVKSFIDIPVVTDASLSLQFEVGTRLNGDLVDQLKVYANGRPVPVTNRSSGRRRLLFKGNIPEAASKDAQNLLRIEFELPTTRKPCDVLPQNRDSNLYGLAFRWVELGPAQ
jgi:hypothetical protein